MVSLAALSVVTERSLHIFLDFLVVLVAFLYRAEVAEPLQISLLEFKIVHQSSSLLETPVKTCENVYRRHVALPDRSGVSVRNTIQGRGGGMG